MKYANGNAITASAIVTSAAIVIVRTATRRYTSSSQSVW